MSSLGSVTNSALTALAANQLALSVASNNISNAQTPGYSRERVLLAPSSGTNDSWGAGNGVDVVGIQALRDQLTTSRLNQETSYKSANDVLQQKLQDIETSFNDPHGTGLLSYITGFFNSFQTLSVDPSSMSNREAVKRAAQSLATAFHTQASNLANEQSVANQAVATDVDKINSLTTRIAQLTSQIQQQETAGSPQNTLRDKRGELVQQLSKIVDVSEIESKGTYELSLGAGPALVLNGNAQNLTAAAGTNGFYGVQAGNEDVTSAIGGGEIQGEIQLRDQSIPGYLNQLDQLAYGIANKVNTIHAAAYDLAGNTGTNFFNPLSSAAGAASNISLNSLIAGSARKIAASQDGSQGDNSAATAIGNLLSQGASGGASVTDQYSTLVFSIGNDVANAQANFNQHDALATQLQNRLQSLSGVSVDEETVQILQFQRAFQASAKVISTVDQMVQTALGMVGA